jgi:hypothetical protein
MLVVLHVGLITNNPNQKSYQKLKSPKKRKKPVKNLIITHNIIISTTRLLY